MLAHLAVGLLTATGCVLMEEDPASPPTAEAPPCSLRSTGYRIDRITLPQSFGEAMDSGFDLDGDEQQRLDNTLGRTFSSLYSTFESTWDLWPESLQAALDDGRAPMLIEIETCDDGGNASYVRVGLRRGSDLDGDGVYEIVDGGLQPAVGDRYSTGMSATGGSGIVPISTLVDIQGTHDAVWVRGDALAFVLRAEQDGSISGSFGIGLREEAVLAAAAPLTDFFTWRLEEGTSGYASALDTDMDGVVSTDELLDDPLIGSLLAADVDLMTEYDGQEVLWPLQDGEKDRLSLGLALHAVPVALE